jgi:hypothetical protein
MNTKDNYAAIVASNLERLYRDLPDDLAEKLPAEKRGHRFFFEAFGQSCCIMPRGITMDEEPVSSVLGILISLYALGAREDHCRLEPFKAFKDLPGSMPYQGAFTTHCEHILVPAVPRIKKALPRILSALKCNPAPAAMGGDMAFLVRPLPKIALCYIFYEADEDFPASATCLISNNALDFIPIDGLADIGEYTSRKILKLIT